MDKRGLSLAELQDVPKNNLILLTGPPGAGKSTFCHQTVLNGLAMERPVIYGLECYIDPNWTDCSNAVYGDTITAIRVAASDPQETPTVRVKAVNLTDDHVFIDAEAKAEGDYFIYNGELTIADSGDWQISAMATDSR